MSILTNLRMAVLNFGNPKGRNSCRKLTSERRVRVSACRSSLLRWRGCYGGITEPSAMAELKKLGFTSVINLRLASETGVDVDAARAAATAAGLTYIHLPFDAADPDPELVDGRQSPGRSRENWTFRTFIVELRHQLHRQPVRGKAEVRVW